QPSDYQKLWLGFERNTNDASGNSNNGVVIHQPTDTTTEWVSGKNAVDKNAFHFNGNDYLQVTNNASLQPTAFSVSFWVSIPSTQPAFTHYVTKYSNGLNGQWFFDSGSGTSSNIRFGITTSDGEHSTPTINLSTGVWHHIVGTFDPSSTRVTLYVDGTQSQTATASGTWTPSGNSNNITIGGPNSLNGDMDD